MDIHLNLSPEDQRRIEAIIQEEPQSLEDLAKELLLNKYWYSTVAGRRENAEIRAEKDRRFQQQMEETRRRIGRSGKGMEDSAQTLKGMADSLESLRQLPPPPITLTEIAERLEAIDRRLDQLEGNEA